MIFGFNTDVKFDDTVYHVQSEARLHELVLQTLVFLKGRCIGKRTNSYAEQTKQPDFSEEYMHEMLKDQHKHFVAAVREGRIEAELGEHFQRAHAEELPPAAAALIAEFAVQDVAAAGSDSQLEQPAAVIVEPEKLEQPTAPTVEPEIITEAIAAAPAALQVDELAAQFAADVASKPAELGLTLIPAGKLIGKGVSLECRPPVAGAEDGVVSVGVEIGDENGPAAGAQVSCRITSGKSHASYVYATTDADGVADIQLALKDLDLTATALLIQASHRSQSASRKFKLQPSS